MHHLSLLPHANAALNGLATILLVCGFLMIRRQRVVAHRRCMLGAFATSAIFLISYVTHYVWRSRVTGQAHTPFNGTGALKHFYYTLLISHIILAMSVPPLALWIIRLGLAGRFERHRHLARWGLPIWLYVSVTGVVVYLLLYHGNPSAP